MIGASDLLWGGAVPAFAAAAALAIVWRLTGKAASAWRTAVVVGYVAGHWGLDARNVGAIPALVKSYQPVEARDWLPLLLLLAIVPDALACVGKRGPLLGWLMRVGLCLFLPWRLLNGSAYLPAMTLPAFDFDMPVFETSAWSTSEAVAWIGGVAAALLLCWQLARVVDQQRGGVLRSTLAVMVTLGGAITVALSASLVYGQLLGVLTATLAGCGLASALFTTGRGPDAATGPVMIASGSLLVVAHFYAELKIYNAGLLLVAMVLAIGWLPLPGRFSPRWQAVCRSAVCVGVLGIAMTLAGLDFAATQTQSENKTKKGRNRMGYDLFSVTNFRSNCDGVESLEERRVSDSAARCHVTDSDLSKNLVLPTEL